MFLEKYPQYKEKVTLILLAAPSRTSISDYKSLKKQVDERIGQINGRYGTIGWAPIWYLYRSLPIEKLVPLYRIADVALITPLRDVGLRAVARGRPPRRQDVAPGAASGD